MSTMSSNTPIVLTLPSDLAYLPLIRNFVESVCRAGGISPATACQIVLATNEAASNAIRHAHQCQPELTVQVQCTLMEGGIEVCLLDEGEPFDLDRVPHLDPSEMRLGGRGVFLMRALLDELTCYQREDGGNVLRMVKRSGEPVAQAEGI